MPPLSLVIGQRRARRDVGASDCSADPAGDHRQGDPPSVDGDDLPCSVAYDHPVARDGLRYRPFAGNVLALELAVDLEPVLLGEHIEEVGKGPAGELRRESDADVGPSILGDYPAVGAGSYVSEEHMEIRLEIPFDLCRDRRIGVPVAGEAQVLSDPRSGTVGPDDDLVLDVPLGGLGNAALDAAELAALYELGALLAGTPGQILVEAVAVGGVPRMVQDCDLSLGVDELDPDGVEATEVLRHVEERLPVREVREHELDLLEAGHELSAPHRDAHLRALLDHHNAGARLGGEPCGGASGGAGADH